MKETRRIVGLLTTYHGFPTTESFYINYLYIEKACHKQGFGQEVAHQLMHLVKESQYAEIRANVALKNWAALRFWTKMGLNSISGIYGDNEHQSDHFADMELMKSF